MSPKNVTHDPYEDTDAAGNTRLVAVPGMEAHAVRSASPAWAALAAPLPPDAIQWRQDGKPTARSGKFFARFVAFIDAQFVRERLDEAAPGQWTSALDLLPPRVTGDGEEDEACAFKCRLTVMGVPREDVGTGKDYKQAATDAFKRAAVRFGIGSELYAMGMNYVQVDGEGKFAKPLEDPAAAYARRNGTPAPEPSAPRQVSAPAQASVPAPAIEPREEACPKCGGKTWDNRVGKKNPKAPDFKCRDKACDGVIWPPKEPKAGAHNTKGPTLPGENDEPAGLDKINKDAEPRVRRAIEAAGSGDIPF